MFRFQSFGLWVLPRGPSEICAGRLVGGGRDGAQANRRGSPRQHRTASIRETSGIFPDHPLFHFGGKKVDLPGPVHPSGLHAGILIVSPEDTPRFGPNGSSGVLDQHQPPDRPP